MSALDWLKPKEASMLLSCGTPYILNVKAGARSGYGGTKWNSVIWKDNMSRSTKDKSEELVCCLKYVDAALYHNW